MGHYCPPGTASPTQYPCAAGSWTNRTNLESQEQCSACPRGWFCLEGSATPTDECFYWTLVPRQYVFCIIKRLEHIYYCWINFSGVFVFTFLTSSLHVFSGTPAGDSNPCHAGSYSPNRGKKKIKVKIQRKMELIFAYANCCIVLKCNFRSHQVIQRGSNVKTALKDTIAQKVHPIQLHAQRKF